MTLRPLDYGNPLSFNPRTINFVDFTKVDVEFFLQDFKIVIVGVFFNFEFKILF